jgi:uncharacterized membrane protein
MVILRIISLLTLSLWLGGLVTLFMSVSAVFGAFTERATAGTAAAAMFARFEVYQLILAAVLTACAGAVWAITRSRMRLAFLVCVVLAGLLGAVSHFSISARLNTMRDQQLTATPEFKRLHGMSMLVYVSQTAVLAVGAVVVAVASGRPTQSARAVPSAAVPPAPAAVHNK